MSASDIELWVYARAIKAQSIESRHQEVMGRMLAVPGPLGFEGLAPPPAPDCGDRLVAAYGLKLSVRGLQFIGEYIYRGDDFINSDSARFDDYLSYRFKANNKGVDYSDVLMSNFPEVIEAFGGYRAVVSYGYHSLHYEAGGNNGYDSNGYPIENNVIFNQLRADPFVDMDGRRFIYTLGPAQYWGAELCKSALGYGADEVVSRLQGLAPKVERLMDGVYLVLNNDPNLSYEDFVAMNERFKAILGLR